MIEIIAILSSLLCIDENIRDYIATEIELIVLDSLTDPIAIMNKLWNLFHSDYCVVLFSYMLVAYRYHTSTIRLYYDDYNE